MNGREDPTDETGAAETRRGGGWGTPTTQLSWVEKERQQPVHSILHQEITSKHPLDNFRIISLLDEQLSYGRGAEVERSSERIPSR